MEAFTLLLNALFLICLTSCSAQGTIVPDGVLDIHPNNPKSDGRQVHATDTPPQQLKRVAICIFGLTRSLNFTISSFRTNVIDPLILADYEYDIFVHTYNITGSTYGRSRASPPFYKMLRPKKVLVDSEDTAQAVSADVGKYLRHGDAWGEIGSHTSLKHLLTQLHSLQQVTSLWEQDASAYDAVIYSRSDLWFYTPINLQQLTAASTADKPSIYLPDFHRYGGENEQFAFGNPEAMLVYGNRGKGALSYAQVKPLHPARFLVFRLGKYRVEKQYTHVLFSRIGTRGVIWNAPVLKGGEVVGVVHDTKSEKAGHWKVEWCSAGYWQFADTPAVTPQD